MPFREPAATATGPFGPEILQVLPCGGGTTLTLTQNQAVYSRMMGPASTDITLVGYTASAFTAGDLIDIGFFDNDGLGGGPGTRIASIGGALIAGGGAYFETPLVATVLNRYWVGVVTNAVGVTILANGTLAIAPSLITAQVNVTETVAYPLPPVATPNGVLPTYQVPALTFL